MKNLFVLLITISLIVTIKIPIIDWDWNWNLDWIDDLVNKLKSDIPTFITNMQNNIKVILQQTEEKKKEYLTGLNTKITELQQKIKEEFEQKKELAQNEVKELIEKITETAKFLSYKVCDAANMDYEECRNDKKKINK